MDTRTGDVAASHRDAAAGAARACHDVLVAMAGRVPDRALWRLRDWLACGADVALRTALPRTLVRHRVGVTDQPLEGAGATHRAADHRGDLGDAQGRQRRDVSGHLVPDGHGGKP